MNVNIFPHLQIEYIFIRDNTLNKSLLQLNKKLRNTAEHYRLRQ